MSEIDNNLKNFIQNDKLSFEPDPAIELRLLNHFRMKAGYSKPCRNMVVPFLAGFLYSKLIGFKIAVIAALIIVFVGYKQIHYQSNKIITTDTCSVNEKSDSIGYLKVADSTSFN